MNDVERWQKAHETAMVGWDFSVLDGRMSADEPDWDFEADCAAALRDAKVSLDLGTGGGERVIRLLEAVGGLRDEQVLHATEGWEPNVPVARRNLAECGAEVRQYDAEAGDLLPYDDGSIDLIMSRHEAVDFAQISRVLSPGGRFLTQQVSGFDAPEIHEWFGAPYAYPNVTRESYVAEATRAGLTVELAEDWAGTMSFTDVEALLTYLGLVPWDVREDFSVTDHLDTLRELEGPITVTQRRFRVYCVRP